MPRDFHRGASVRHIKSKPADKPGSVTARSIKRAMTVIHLGAALPQRSSHLPADSASSVIVRLLGVAPDGGCRVSPAPASVLTKRERLVSVALFLAFIAARADDLMASGRYPASRSAEPGLSSPRPGSFFRTGSDGLADFEAVF